MATCVKSSRRLAPIFSGLVMLAALAVGPVNSPADADLLVSSTGTNQVLQYDATTGAFVRAFVTAGSGGLNAPRNLVIGPNGNLFVSSENTNQVLEYNGATGAFITAFVTAGNGGLNGPRGLLFLPTGQLLVSSLNTDQILRYNASTGAFLGVFATETSGSAPWGLILGPNGNVFVNNEGAFGTGDVEQFTPTGVDMGAFVAPGGTLMHPRGILFDPFNNDLLVDNTDGHNVLAYNGTTGAFISIFAQGGLNGGLNGPRGLTLGPNGNLFVNSNDTNLVQEYNGTNGAFVTTFVSAGSGGLNKPHDLIFDALAQPAAVPLPASLLLLASGLAGLAIWRGRAS